ncbi:HD-GYP domain-containing protein [Anaerobacillus sp. CMMVII]|uniref:HD-GYP domain-containing protein n=1 Tax=Anaerobacillus sp. CMMVII TaxID=2755588 RepID=UPI0021B78958|nr:HD-GYP domain-containing protein [Anaerobacillus sp. CMMVII]MCT8136315.1 HD-GYP domain-containing protein [Anaerobacillus sp. CMMVII]
MKVKPNQLIVGCILANDIHCNSNQILMRKKTILTEEYINVVKAFLIEDIEVESHISNGMTFSPREVIPTDEINEIGDSCSFRELYLQAVVSYKKLFQGWQAGLKVDILPIRKILLSLLDKLDEAPDEIISIHSYATKVDYIYHHAVSVGALSAYLGRMLNLTYVEQIQIGLAGLMADSGMSKTPNSIIYKKNSLTASEFEEMKRHPMLSYQMIKDIPGITDGVLLGVVQHHEREDGSGYPMAVTSQKLHKFSKIIAVVDVFHAMTSERTYKSKQSPYQVIELIRKDNFGKFDIKIVQTLESLIANFSIGTRVKLNNGEEGEVVFLEPQDRIRPMVRSKVSGEFIKLANRSDLYIDEII